ncbi:MAG TPA: class I adenylate-forming enzyme family protein, partial [Pseudonocardiaceae bacterium]|nr:class I adenylate-forming enzyme family protein [Pseudonocardiaceae bacterium]
MTGKSVRAQLFRDPDLGAGNVLTTLVERGFGLDRPTFTFDTPVDGLVPAWQALTLAELDERVRARATSLQALGIRRRDPVAVLTMSAADTILVYHALLRLGAIPALVNPRVPAELAALFLSRLQAEAVVIDKPNRDKLAGLNIGIPLMIEAEGLGAGDPAAAPAPYRFYAEDAVAITHSSGTTGVPKAVVHSHESLFASIRHKLRMPVAHGTERMLNALPAPHVATLIVVNQSLANQTELLSLSIQTGPSIVDTIESWQPNGVFGFATTWADLARQDLSGRNIDSVSMWFNTGDCAHEAHIRRLVALGHRTVATSGGRVQETGSVFIDGLGSSEMGHSHFFITHTKDSDRYGRCVGRPYSFCELVVLDPDGNELPNYEVGELGTKSPTNSIGYWNNSATQHRTRVRGYFLTGDLVYRDDEGYFYHMDRLVDSVDLGNGKRLYTAMSEERILAACEDVVDCTVSAV